MQGLSRRHLLAFGAFSVLLAGCASITRERHLELQRPDETLVKNRAGRFSVEIIQTPPLSGPRGSQGRFEWLEYRSDQATRRLLIIIGPFGQSLGGAEQIEPGQQQEFALNLFDEQGLLLERKEQWRLLSSLIGRPVQENTAHSHALKTLMQFFSRAVESAQGVQEIEVSLAEIALRFRIALDAQ